MRNAFFLFSIMMLSATAVQSANFATLSDVSGSVLVNWGEGYVPADPARPLKPGDKILLKENSMATVSFAECAVALAEPTIFTVTEIAPCKDGAALPTQSFTVTPTSSDAEVPGVVAARYLITAGMLVGSGLVLIDAVTDEDDPASANGK